MSPIRTIFNAHNDDIHGLISLPNEQFVSGSKDQTLKIWDWEGHCLQTINPSDSRYGYAYWITSLTSLDNGLWASGTRDGVVTVWDAEGNEQSSILYTLPKAQYVCKERNKFRINCITQTNDTFLYTGTPKYIQLWNTSTEKMVKYYKASENDWVYCIDLLDNSRDLLVVIGSQLEVWNLHKKTPVRTSLIEEDQSTQKRPHISAITRLEGDSNMVAAAAFDGTVKIVDISAQTVLATWEAHVGRVWSVINLDRNTLASSADDAKIKIWDVRQFSSVATLSMQNPGRVSSLLRLDSTQFISASCPDDLRRTRQRASISFWDINKLT